MDFYEGKNILSQLQLNYKFSEDQTVFIIAQVAIALNYMHEKGFIYRHLKPENIMYSDDGYIVLTDFTLTAKY